MRTNLCASSLRVTRLRDEMCNEEPTMSMHMDATVHGVMSDIGEKVRERSRQQKTGQTHPNYD
jgi:hypothetical protein